MPCIYAVNDNVRRMFGPPLYMVVADDDDDIIRKKKEEKLIHSLRLPSSVGSLVRSVTLFTFLHYTFRVGSGAPYPTPIYPSPMRRLMATGVMLPCPSLGPLRPSFFFFLVTHTQAPGRQQLSSNSRLYLMWYTRDRRDVS